MKAIKDFFIDLFAVIKSRGSNYDEEKLSIIVRLGITAVIIAAQILLIRLTWHIAKIIQAKGQTWGETHLKPLRYKKIVLLETRQMQKVFAVLVTALKWFATAIQLFLTIPMIFSLYEATRGLAKTLLGYITTPLKNFAIAFWHYIPNIFAIVIILLIAKYAMRALKFFTTQIQKKKIVIPGFYAEWADPTFNILRVLLVAFTVVAIFPYLPNSDSDIFKGVSALVAILFSLGSSSIVGNLIAGIVMTYMRPFQTGDRIKINDVTGFVAEKGAMVTSVRTSKNEYVSFPNSMILNTSVTNFNSSTLLGQPGLIIHTDVTMGYDVPWRTVHEILLEAASKTERILKDPPPFVNQCKLDDFYCWYEINGYTKDVVPLANTYSDLYKNIQDGFTAAGISMFAPHFQIQKQVDTI